jgi:ribokinase
MQRAARPGGVAVLGAISADLTVFGRQLPRPGETVIADEFSLVLGGKGANQAVAAARAGASTYMIGAVGADLFEPLTLGALRAEGIDISAVKVLPGHTGIAHIRVNRKTAENDIMVVPHANAMLTSSMVEGHLRRLRDRVSVLLLQLEVPIETVVAAIKLGRQLGYTVVLDPAPAQPLAGSVWRLVDVVTPNELEAEAVTGVLPTDLSSAESAGRWFTERGVAAAVLTVGDRGVVVVTADAVRQVASHRVEPVDTTAAGDAFTGTLGAGLAAGLDWGELLARSTAAGALTVTRPGASSSVPTRAEVDAFLRSRSGER